MPRWKHLVTPLACLALIAGSGCGSDEEEEPAPGIPAAAADQLSRELDLVQRRIDVTREQSAPGSCRDVESKSYPDIQQIVEGLPDDTDPEVRRALEESIDRLKELTESECSELIDEIEKRREEETPPPPAPSPAPPEPEPPPQTETQPPPETKPKEEKPKEDDKQDEGTGGLSPDGRGPGGQGPPGQGGGGQPAPPAQDG